MEVIGFIEPKRKEPKGEVEELYYHLLLSFKPTDTVNMNRIDEVSPLTVPSRGCSRRSLRLTKTETAP